MKIELKVETAIVNNSLIWNVDLKCGLISRCLVFDKSKYSKREAIQSSIKGLF